MFYEPVQHERFFEKDRRYSEIDWSNFREVVSAWERCIRGWYIEPIEYLLERDLTGWRRRVVSWIVTRPSPGHYAFTVMSVTCLLIDALSQYRYGELSSEGAHFRSFVDSCLNSYAGTLPNDIWHYDHKYSTNGKKLTKYSEVLWNGYRCGILHQAHAPLYCGIIPGHSAPQFEPTNHAKYGPGAINPNSVIGADCPMTNVCPEHLFDEVKGFFDQYVLDLINPLPAHDLPNGIRVLFKKKFSDSFGVDITSATL